MAERNSAREEQQAHKLADPSADVKVKLQIAIELKENCDQFLGPQSQPANFGRFLDRFMPVFMQLLKTRSSGPHGAYEEKLRHTMLDIIHRLPSSPAEPLAKYAPNLADLLLGLVLDELEDSAVLCVKILMDLHRHYNKILGKERAEQIIKFIINLLKVFPALVKKTFDDPQGSSAPTIPSTPANTTTFQSPRPGSPLAIGGELTADGQAGRSQVSGRNSFKIYHELPIVLVALFHAYTDLVEMTVKEVVPLIIDIMMAQAGPQEEAHKKAEAEGRKHTSVSPNIKNRAAFGEFISAQVKSLGFFSYALRNHHGAVTDVVSALPKIFVRLLKDCPSEKFACRKELLAAMRHIINFNQRRIFIGQIDEFLDENVLLGDSLTVHETMRALAYSMLADLIHHVRLSIRPPTIRRSIDVYARNLMDENPGTGFQTMSIKLLVNVTDPIAQLTDKAEARHFLMMILDAFAEKFAYMNRAYPNALKLHEQFKKNQEDNGKDAREETYLADPSNPPKWDETDIFSAAPIPSFLSNDRTRDPLSDGKFLIRNLITGVKTVIFHLRTCNPPTTLPEAQLPEYWNDVAHGFTSEELNIIRKLFREGAYAFRYYTPEKPSAELQTESATEYLAHYQVKSKEEKDHIEIFATVFSVLEPATFYEVIQPEIPRLYDMILEHPSLVHIPQFLLASADTSTSFCGILLDFLLARLEDIGTSDIRKGAVLLRLWKLTFMTVTLFAEETEPILLPHTSNFILKCFSLSRTAQEPLHYFQLLKSCFRAIGGGKFESIYKEVLPLLETMLDTLNTLLMASRKTADRELFVVLILTVPVRLSHLHPFLDRLMRSLVIALRSKNELLSQGLRTLELFVDNLTAEYVDPIMAPVMDELMTALWDLLRPLPYSHLHAHTAVRILGKLGGRNRKFWKDPPTLPWKQFPDDPCSINLKLRNATIDAAFPATMGITLAYGKLLEVPGPGKVSETALKSDKYYKLQAFKLLSSQLKLFIGADNLPQNFAQMVRLQANDLVDGQYENAYNLSDKSDRIRSVSKRNEQEQMLRTLLKALIFSLTLPDLKEEAESLMQNVCRHFAIIEIGKALAVQKQTKRGFNVNAGEGPLYLDSKILADATLDMLSHESPAVRDNAITVITYMYDSACLILGNEEKADRHPFFGILAKVFCHGCYEEEWFTKAGACLGLEILTQKLKLNKSWVLERNAEFVRALMYSIKDIPQDLPIVTQNQAKEVMSKLVLDAAKSFSKDDINTSGSKLNYLCGFFSFELASVNKFVRTTAQETLTLIAKTIGAEVHELITPIKDKLLKQIVSKPLRALPFMTQIGYMDALTFCLTMHSSLVEFNEELNRLLMEALALADAEDDALSTKPGEHRNADSIYQLRTVCICLLSKAMAFEDFGGGSQIRQRIISVFFKSLYSKSSDVIEAANNGLKGVIAPMSKIPKQLLQTALGPILFNLQDPRRLNVAGMDGLARLLKLLFNYFKVEIGTRLLDHLKTFAEPNDLLQISFKQLDHASNVKIISSILNIYHLLPAGAVMFLQPLVTTVIDFEGKLRRCQGTPFRAPLKMFLIQYPKQSWTYFAGKLTDMKHGRLFSQILADDASEPLRDAVKEDIEGLLECFKMENTEERFKASINALHILHAIATRPQNKEWVTSKPELRQILLKTAKEFRQQVSTYQVPTNMRIAIEQSEAALMDILLVYLREIPQDVDFLFEVVDAITAKHLKTTWQTFHFIYEGIVSNKSLPYWRTLMMRCFDAYSNKDCPHRIKTFTFHYFVNPIIAMDVMRTWEPNVGPKGSKLLDKSMVDAVNTKLWRPNLADVGEDSAQDGIDHSRMELLQMSAMLFKWHWKLVAETRKDAIKFGWNYIKLEDTINKHAAYVVLAYFIYHYDTPPKIVLQVYVALLKAYHPESKHLVTQALTIIAQILTERLQPPLWAKFAKKIITEDGGNVPQLSAIFQFMVRYPDLFYESRKDFVTWIVSSLYKIVPGHQQSGEAKRLALRLLELILKWERMAEDGVKIEKGSIGEKVEYTMPAPVKLMAVKFLVHFLSTINERFPVPFAADMTKKYPISLQPGQPVPQSTVICETAMNLLRNLLSLKTWQDLDFGLFEKSIKLTLTCDEALTPTEKHINLMVNALSIIRIVINLKDDEWVKSKLPELKELLEKPLRLNLVDIQECLHCEDSSFEEPKLRPLMKRIMDVVPAETVDEDDMEIDDKATEFATFLGQIANDSLAKHNYYSAVYAFWTLGKRIPALLDKPLEDLIKWVTDKLARDHVAVYSPGQGRNIELQPGEDPPPLADTKEFEIQAHLLMKVIDVFCMRMLETAEKRRALLSLLASLAEKSHYVPLCEKILGIVREWIFNPTGPHPSLKEKTAVLNKMLIFQSRADQSLLQKFLELIIGIYEDKEITRSELTVRLEHAFLVGTKAQDYEMRHRFMKIFDKSISRSAVDRFIYVMNSQSWEALADSFWLTQASLLLVGSLDMENSISLNEEDFRTFPLSTLTEGYESDLRKDDVMLDEQFEEFILKHRAFCIELSQVKTKDIVKPLSELQCLDANLGSELWTSLFPIFWALVPKDERLEFEKGMVTLLTRDFHHRQADKRPNVVQALLDGCIKARPILKLPPHVLKFVSRTYDAWYAALFSLEESVVHPIIDTPTVRESTLDALVELYSSLQEDDLFYGTWRRRCQYVETNAALSYEQIGMWDNAQKMYEAATIKARTGAMPFSQGEYMLWEDHWVRCAKKLQQWDILSDFAKHENFNDLLLECAWRQIENWSSDATKDQLDSIIKSLMDAPTPRRIFFQAFMSLLKLQRGLEKGPEFSKVCDEAVQLSLRKWHQLPRRLTKAHIPLLLNFQQLVELHDANAICKSLQVTNQSNLDTKSQELKMLLGAWRVRLPNLWDDINAWQDLVTWRQHIFTLINNTYIPLVPQTNPPNATGNSYAYRGYHETAWIMNRFAHVARKHNLPDVCTAQLSRIYTLPNIEIQEAFLKLREQAKCHYQNRNELSSGLDVIKNTNLNYFGAQQKAEFFTLKGMFLAKLKQNDEANNAFGTALGHDMKMPKAWEEWGYYNDQLFKENPTDMQAASHAVACYLEAAGLFRNHKSRKLIARMLWLLSLDDAQGKISSAFEEFKGETPTWYWITFIPQLLNALAHKEGRIARVFLARIAKQYPQALFFLLRTSRDDYAVLKKQTALQQQQKAKQAAASAGTPSSNRAETPARPSTAGSETPNTNGAKPATNGNQGSPKPNAANGTANANATTGSSTETKPPVKKMPWEYTEELLAILKTAVPLLALSMETLVDQIQKNSKCHPDEDAYRLIVALLNDGLSYIGRVPGAFSEDVKLPAATEANIVRFAETILPAHIRSGFEADFVAVKPNLYTYIQKLRKWRDRFEEKLDSNPNAVQGLEIISPHLSDFRFQKLDEIEIPGQYLELKDSNKYFVKMERIMPNVERVRSIGITFRRMQIRGHDGSIHPFAVQQPTGRLGRREERMIQLFRIFNATLAKRTESRRRNLAFHLPIIVPFGQNLRLVQDDISNTSLQAIYDNHCRMVGMAKDEPILFTMKKLKKLPDTKSPVSLHNNPASNERQKYQDQAFPLRLETFVAIQETMVPNTLVLDYFKKIYPSFSDFWLFRRQFSYQMACITFLSYVMHLNNRLPSRMMISQSTGNIFSADMVPALMTQKPIFNNPDAVPIRLTPNLQTLMGPIATEGIFSCAVMVIARCLTEPEGELEQQLSVFVKDEMVFWYQQQSRSNLQEQIREATESNSAIIVKKAMSLGQPPLGNLPANQTVIDLISRSTNPMQLAQSDPQWMPYL